MRRMKWCRSSVSQGASRVIGALAVVVLLTLGTSIAHAAESVSVWYPSNAAYLERVVAELDEEFVDEFRAETGMDVSFRKADPRDLELAFARGQGPDVVITFADLGLRHGFYGRLIPLNEHLKEWDGYPQVAPNLWQREHGTGRVFAVPFSVANASIAYNKDIFSETGFDPETPIQSWEELYESARKMTKRLPDGRVRLGFDSSLHWDRWFFEILRAQNGSSTMWSEDLRTTTIDDERSIETLTFMRNLFRLPIPEVLSSRETRVWARGTVETFAEGRTAMLFGGPFVGNELAGRGDWDRWLGLFDGRRSPDVEPVTLALPYGLGIFAYAGNPDGAWSFIEWLMRPNSMARLHARLGTIPTRFDAVEPFAELRPEQALWARLLRQATAYPYLPWHVTPILTWSGLDDAVEQALHGEREPRESLTRVGLKWQASYDRFWRQHDTQIHLEIPVQRVRGSLPVRVDVKTPSDYPVAHVTLYLNGEEFASGMSVPFNARFDTRSLAEGRHEVTARVVTGAGAHEANFWLTEHFIVPDILYIDAPDGAVSGEVAIGVDVRVPEGDRLESVRLNLGSETLYQGSDEQAVVRVDTLQLEDDSHVVEATAVIVHEGEPQTFVRTRTVLVRNWELFQDDLLPPFDGWFGATDRSKTVDRSSGWVYLTEDAERFFGDDSRLGRSGDSPEYLTWEHTRLREFRVTVYSLQRNVDHQVAISVSANGADWVELPYETVVLEATDDVSKLELRGQVGERDAPNYLRLTLQGTAEREDGIQLGSGHLRSLRE